MMVAVGLLFEILSIIICLHYLYGEKFKLDVITIGFIIGELTWILFVTYKQWNPNWIMLIYFVWLIYSGFKFGFHFKKLIINSILCVVIMSGLQTTIILLYNIFVGAHRVSTEEQVLINLLIFFVIILVLKRCKIQKLSEVLQSRENLIKVSAVIGIITLMIFLVNYRQAVGFDILYYVLFLLCIVLIAYVAIDIGKHKMKAREAEAELRLHKLYEQSYQSLIEDIRAKQHEFDNHINAIHSQHHLYHTYEELVEAQKEYCSEIERENYYNKVLSKGNPVIISFLYSKFKEAEKRKLTVSYRIAIKDLDCNVPVYKMVELLGNLLNNAMEALSADKELKKMSVVITEYDDNIRIEVANECKDIDYDKLQEFFRKGYSEKGKNRGYGLYNVKKICDDYHVELKTSIKDMDNRKWLFFEMDIGKSVNQLLL